MTPKILDLGSIDWGLMPSSHDNALIYIYIISVNVSLVKMTAQAKGVCLTLGAHHPYPIAEDCSTEGIHSGMVQWCSAYFFFCVLAH